MNVRPARLEDCDALVALLNEIIEIGGTTAYTTPKSNDYFVALIESDEARTLIHVAQDAAGAILGFQFLKPLDPPEQDIGSIATFAKVGATQKGIGTALFAATRAASRVAGYRGISAVIRADNSGGLAYYTRMGFADYALERDVALGNGLRVDRIEKRLNL